MAENLKKVKTSPEADGVDNGVDSTANVTADAGAGTDSTSNVTADTDAGADSTANVTADTDAGTSNEVVKIKFLLSPTGKFNLAYCVGEVAELNDVQANELIEAGYAEIAE